jgi:hypothetical protein
MPRILRSLLLLTCVSLAHVVDARAQGFFVAPDTLRFVAPVGAKDIDTLMFFAEGAVDIGMDHDLQGVDKRYFQTNKPRFFQMQTENGRYPLELTFSCEADRAFTATLHVTDYITHFYVQLVARSATFSDVGDQETATAFHFDSKRKVLRVPPRLHDMPCKIADLLGRVVYATASSEGPVALPMLTRGTYFVIAANERFKFHVGD